MKLFEVSNKTLLGILFILLLLLKLLSGNAQSRHRFSNIGLKTGSPSFKILSTCFYYGWNTGRTIARRKQQGEFSCIFSFTASNGFICLGWCLEARHALPGTRSCPKVNRASSQPGILFQPTRNNKSFIQPITPGKPTGDYPTE
jgi:hypothetical protein